MVSFLLNFFRAIKSTTFFNIEVREIGSQVLQVPHMGHGPCVRHNCMHVDFLKLTSWKLTNSNIKNLEY